MVGKSLLRVECMRFKLVFEELIINMSKLSHAKYLPHIVGMFLPF